ncbi:MAG: hypothetical protein ACRDFB_10290 [Rhabdochlamydiaceae bacterium]
MVTFSFLLNITLVVLLFLSAGSFFSAPWMPTRKRDFAVIANLMKPNPKDMLYDLSSGTGEFLFFMSKKYNIRGVGIEISPLLYLYSKTKSLFYKNVKIVYGNFYHYNLSDADIVYAFLMPKKIVKLRDKLSRKLSPHAKIIISSWPLENHPAINSKKDKQ